MGIGEQGAEIQNEAEAAGHSTLKRLLLWVEKEAHLAGADIETEVTVIMDKLRRKEKSPK